jgi:hypothetical protein
VGTAVQSHYFNLEIEMFDNKAEGLELAKRAVELDVKEKMILAITEMKDFDKIMRLKESVMIWTNTKF